MRLSSTFVASILAGGLLLSAVPLSAHEEAAVAPAEPNSQTSGSLASSFADALNTLRVQNGRSALREDSRLTRAAQAYAEDMARHDYFSHTGRDGSNVMTRARAAGCQGRGYAENIAWGQRSAQEAFSGWAASSGHLRNMLGSNYGAFGLGQSAGYWVLVFADGC